MARQGVAVAQDNDLHAGSGDSHIHAAQVAQKTYLPLSVGAHQRDDDDIALLTLETIYGIYTDVAAEGLEELTPHEQPPQILHLSTIWRDDAHIDALVEQALLADALKVVLQDIEREPGLGFVDTAIALAHKLLSERQRLAILFLCVILTIWFISKLSSVNPLHGGVEVEYAAEAHFGGALHL